MALCGIDRDLYLQRLHLSGPPFASPPGAISQEGVALTPDAEILRALHVAHITRIPYENLDILAGRPYDLTEEALFDKMVRRGQGGFCYELNPLFAALLRALGYSVDLLSARIVREDHLGPEFDHAVLLVHLEEPWLADVGNARWFDAPLRLEAPGVQVRHGRAYRVIRDGDDEVVCLVAPDGREAPQYRFTRTPHPVDAFLGACHEKWTSPGSRFSQRPICSRITPESRIRLTDTQFTTDRDGEQTEIPIQDGAEFLALLGTHFGPEFVERARPLRSCYEQNTANRP